jgi:hypothetical protein
VAEAVGQRRRNLPAVSGPVRRVGPSHDPHPHRQGQVTHRPVQRQRQHRCLHGRRAGGQLIEEQVARSLGREPTSERGRGQDHPVVGHQRKACDVSRFADRTEHRLARHPLGGGDTAHEAGLAHARIGEQQDRHGGTAAGVDHGDSGGEVAHCRDTPFGSSGWSVRCWLVLPTLPPPTDNRCCRDALKIARPPAEHIAQTACSGATVQSSRPLCSRRVSEQWMPNQPQ